MQSWRQTRGRSAELLEEKLAESRIGRINLDRLNGFFDMREHFKIFSDRERRVLHSPHGG